MFLTRPIGRSRIFVSRRDRGQPRMDHPPSRSSRAGSRGLLGLASDTSAGDVMPGFNPSATLEFNGHELRWIENGNIVRRWPAVSGRSGFQSSGHQYLKDIGPLPEGRYIVGQSRIDNLADAPPQDLLFGLIGRGHWPGLRRSWGTHRIWLEPAPETDTHGRSGFSIHGGRDPGSAGCIDLTGHMDDFLRTFRDHGRDLNLRVIYPQPRGAR